MDKPDSESNFPGAAGKAIPYGIYDVGANTGWVNVGTDHDTAAFAVNTLRTWWNTQGRAAYPAAAALTITAGSGGSDGSRLRAWKTGLAVLAAGTGLATPCCTCRRVPAGGIGSSAGCSPRSP